MHPAIGGEDPEAGDGRAGRNEYRGGHVQPRSHALPPEKHDAEKGGLEKERRQHFVTDQRSNDIAGHLGEARPIRAELVREGNARDHPHGKGHGEDLRPEACQPVEVILAGSLPEHQERRHIGGKADGEGREDDVEADRERELEAGEDQGIGVHCRSSSRIGNAPRILLGRRNSALGLYVQYGSAGGLLGWGCLGLAGAVTEA